MLTAVEEEIRVILLQLCNQSADAVESETLEIKSWCNDERTLAEKASEAAACIANAKGGFVLLGIPDQGISNFSFCPHPNVTRTWIHQRIQDLTTPSVQCTVLDVSELARQVSSNSNCHVFAIRIPQTSHPSGHLTSGGVSKIRSGKECKPYFANLHDDRTKSPVAGLVPSDLLQSSIAWAIGLSARTRKMPTEWDSSWNYLSHIQAITKSCDNDDGTLRFEVSLAGLLFFGAESALRSHLPAFETVVISPLGTSIFKKNVIETYRELCGTKNSFLPSLCPSVQLQSIQELLVNAYIHRDYRTNGPVLIRVLNSCFEVESPGGLPPGMDVANLIHCTPVYRNFLAAEIGRLIGICDKVGEGIDTVYRDVLRGGLGFPVFESGAGRFSARIELEVSEDFKSFLSTRSQALTELDEVVVLRWLWSRRRSNVREICNVMQRGMELGQIILERMAKKFMIEPISNEPGIWQLNPTVLRDIEDARRQNQLRLNLQMWGSD